MGLSLVSLVTQCHTRPSWPLSLSALVSDPAASRPPVEREDVHRLSVRGVEAARPDLRYPPFSLTKLRRGRAFATCSLPQYGQIPATGALLVTSRRPSGTASSGLGPLPIFPRCCMWIFFSCLLKSYLGRRTFHLAISSSNHF